MNNDILLYPDIEGSLWKNYVKYVIRIKLRFIS